MIFVLIFLFSIRSFASLPDYTHDRISRSIENFATSIDRFFADDTALNYENKSRIRLYTDTLIRESSENLTTADIKAQLNFPGTEETLQLIIESRDEDIDENDISDRSNNQSNIESKNDTKAGIQYFLDKADFKTSLGTGIIFREINPLPFIRFRVKKNITFGKWLFRPENETLWVSSEGTVSNIELDFDYKLSHKFLFRFANFTGWNDQDYIFEFSNGPSVYHRINEKIALSYNARVLSSNTPSQAVNNYTLSVGYRQLLYKKWFFWTATPLLEFPEEENFKRTPSFNVRFEVIFGHI